MWCQANVIFVFVHNLRDFIRIGASHKNWDVSACPSCLVQHQYTINHLVKRPNYAASQHVFFPLSYLFYSSKRFVLIHPPTSEDDRFLRCDTL